MPPKKPTQSSALDSLLDILDLEPLEQNLFRGRSPQHGWQRVFGGQVLGQALVAAVRTVPRIVSPTRCMAIPAARRSQRARSSTRSSASATARASRRAGSWPSSTAGRCSHERLLPDRRSGPGPPKPMPDGAVAGRTAQRAGAEARMLPQLPANMRSYWERERPIEMRPVDVSRYVAREKRAPEQYDLDARQRHPARRHCRCISACWPTLRISRCWIPR